MKHAAGFQQSLLQYTRETELVKHTCSFFILRSLGMQGLRLAEQYTLIDLHQGTKQVIPKKVWKACSQQM